jgi:TetR/AcrR family transcriptional regulator, transcriptional repressor for nem operon
MSGRPRGFEEDHVLQRAMEVFWEHGYNGTGIADLERATGLGRQSLYGAFGDKRALFEKVVDYYGERVLKAGLVDVLDAPGSARANLEQVFAGWETLATSPNFNGCLVGSAVSLHDPELRELLRRKLHMLEEAFTRTLRRAQEAGEVNAALEPRATARSLLALMQGMSVVARVQTGPAFVRSVIDTLRRQLD